LSPDVRAIVFDLDDTLYPYRRFVTSGFAAVAEHFEREYGTSAPDVFDALVRAHHGPDHGRELQVAIRDFGLPASSLADAIRVMHEHDPHLLLPTETRDALGLLRQTGWRVGVLTNGIPAVQARKIAALRLEGCVDTVVYATEYGSGGGKPQFDAFQEIARRLDVPLDRTVMVGNDEHCDIEGATTAGMLAIQCRAWMADDAPTAADAVAERLTDVPALARALVERASDCHAA
jgi:putative hydrolase of the HAD superfamily